MSFRAFSSYILCLFCECRGFLCIMLNMEEDKKSIKTINFLFVLFVFLFFLQFIFFQLWLCYIGSWPPSCKKTLSLVYSEETSGHVGRLMWQGSKDTSGNWILPTITRAQKQIPPKLSLQVRTQACLMPSLHPCNGPTKLWLDSWFMETVR